jgi:hypothetical protein
MATEGEMYRIFRDFLINSFSCEELEVFLTLNDYGEAADSADRQVD